MTMGTFRSSIQPVLDVHVSCRYCWSDGAYAANVTDGSIQIVTHTETREMPIHALIVKQAGKLGPKLRPSSESCGDPSKPASRRARYYTLTRLAASGSRLNAPISTDSFSPFTRY
jgi:hypothetical protein